MNHKQINKAVASLLGDPELYDVRHEFQVVKTGLTFEAAQSFVDSRDESIYHLYTITSSLPDNYVEDINLALYAAKRIAEKNKYTFVLSLEDGMWRAAFGDYGDCSEYTGVNPAYCTCISILKFCGKF